MTLLSRLFKSNKVDCPRCLGKGNVDLEDIKRLKQELYWAPSTCAYCNGKGKVPPEMVAMVNVDIAYLTTNLTGGERKRLFNGDAEALQRAKEYVAKIDKIIEQIEHQYYLENQEVEQIADYLLSNYSGLGNSSAERQKIIEYVEKVIRSKLPHK